MTVTVELDDDAALVVFDLLAGLGENDEGRQLVFSDAGARNALWLLEAALEKRLVVPFQADYEDQVRAARKRLELRGGPW